MIGVVNELKVRNEETQSKIRWMVLPLNKLGENRKGTGCDI